MPIGPFESEVLHTLASQRNPDSYIGGATVLHQSPDSPRTSADIDVFHDTVDAVQRAVTSDTQTLQGAGYRVEVTSQQESFCRAIVTKGGLATKLEWVQDSAFRFFPVEPDVEMGWRLNFWDAATNKILAFGSREKLRDWVDVMYLHNRHLPLGALVWAAAGKDAGITPELLLDSAKRFSQFPIHDADWNRLQMSPPGDHVRFKQQFLQAVSSAEILIAKLPPAEMGCFYLGQDGKPVCPNPDHSSFHQLTRHFGSIKGAWPRIVAS